MYRRSNLKQHFMNAFKVVNHYVLFVVLIGVASAIMRYPVISVVSLIISILVHIIIFGKITHAIKGKANDSVIALLRANTVNYLAVAVVMSGVFFLLNRSFISMYELTGFYNREYAVALTGLLKTTLKSLSIYILPFVFVYNVSLPAITKGFMFFFRNPEYSIFIIPISTLSILFSRGLDLWLLNYMADTSSTLYVFSMRVLGGVVLAYLSILLFAVAAYVLVEPRHDSCP